MVIFLTFFTTMLLKVQRYVTAEVLLFCSLYNEPWSTCTKIQTNHVPTGEFSRNFDDFCPKQCFVFSELVCRSYS